jgi:hypothetical protein
MSVIIEIRKATAYPEVAFWTRRGGILGYLAGVLETENPELANILREAEDETFHYYLTDLEIPDFQLLTKTVIREVERELRESGGNRLFSELKALLVTDERAQGIYPTGKGKIVVSPENEITAPAWTYDLLLELLGDYVNSLSQGSNLSSLLFDSRIIVGSQLCDLSSIPAEDFLDFAYPIDMLLVCYTGIRDSAAPEFENELYPRVKTLFGLFHADARLVDVDWSNL